MREQTIDIDSFARRHIGPNKEEVRAMLAAVGFDSLDALIDATVPKDIRLKGELNLPEAKSEGEALDELHSAASDGNVRAVTPMSNAELISWLYEVIYTARETMNEIESKNVEAEVGLTLVRRSS